MTDFLYSRCGNINLIRIIDSAAVPMKRAGRGEGTVSTDGSVIS
jgi:hypothetical protein